jgi:hypothetical protein
LFPTTLTYDPKDDFFIPMDSGSKRQLILVDQNSDGTVLVCSRCSTELRKGERPKWAVQFEPAATVETLFELKGVDACCAKVMNEFVELSGKPPTLKDKVDCEV